MARTYLTLEQVSERLHIKAGTARNRLSRGEPMPPSIKVGRRRLFPEDAFDRWMAAQLGPVRTSRPERCRSNRVKGRCR